MRLLMLNWKDTRHPLAGGAEVYTQRVLEHLAGQGHEVTLFCAAVEGESVDERVNGVRIVRRGGRLGVYPAAHRFLRETRGEWDVIVEQVNTIAFWARASAGGTPVVVLSHQLAREVWYSEMPYPIAVFGRFVAEPVMLRGLRRLPSVTVSESSASEMLRCGFTDVEVLGQGGEMGEIRAASDGIERSAEPRFVFCGRLGESKRPGDAVDAFARYVHAGGEGRLVLLGDGPLREGLRQRVEGDAALRGRVEVRGRVSFQERCAEMASAWALLVPSVREGWGLVVSEAAACGTRAIGYDVPGLRDSIPACGGVLCRATPAAMAAAMAEHAGRLAASRQTGGTGTVEWEELGARWERYLEGVANRHGGESAGGGAE